MSVIGAPFGYAFWKDDEQAGSYRFVGRIRIENALVLIEKFSTSILGTLRGRYRMPSGIILYQTSFFLNVCTPTLRRTSALVTEWSQ